MFNRYTRGGSMSRAPEISEAKRIEVHAPQVNDSLYELSKPSDTPSMEILFFHGLTMGNSSEPHLSTWESEDGTCNWPQEWLAEEFPEARLLAVSYNECIGKSSKGGSDMYVICENLLSDVMEQNIGQNPNCPVVLVGHCFGGLVIKEVCLRASSSIELSRFPSDKAKGTNFLKNLKGVFFYGTPHHGSLCIEKFGKNMDIMFLDYFKALGKEASRLDFKFDQLCKVNAAWRIDGLGESRHDESGPFAGVVVASEGTSRKGDHFNVVATNHLLICKPRDKTDRRFYAFKSLLLSIADAQVEVHQCPGLPLYPFQLETRALELQAKLMSGGVLGIFGMGGVGKTTLAKQVFNSFSKEFEYTCFVTDVKDVPRYDLELQILRRFHLNGKSNAGKTQWSHLREKKALIVMDDADSHDQLKALPELRQWGAGSCVIITSRDKDVFTFYGDCMIYEVNFLEKDDARKLLCQHTFETVDIPENVPDLLIEEVHALVDKCAGLPLTLEVMGRYLREHKSNVTIWRETLSKLGKAKAIGGGQNDRVWASLKVSYDALLEDEQKMFMEAALIFYQQPLDRALGAWTSLSENTETTWANLVSRALVKEYCTDFQSSRHGLYGPVVWVHEQLRDLAKNIALEADEKANSLVAKLNAKKVQSKYMDLVGAVNSNGRGKGLTSELYLLRWNGVLRLEEVPQRACLPCVQFRSKERLSKFKFNLRKMEHLAVLELTNLVVTEDFREALGDLTNLRILKLSNLEGFQDLPENFGNLSRLKRLVLEKLDTLIIPDSIGNLSELEYLTFCEIPTLVIPESLGNLYSLVVLVIMDSKKLAGLPDSFGRPLTSLKELVILSLKELVILSLKELVIYDCPLLKRLPNCFSQLPQLQTLTIRATGLEELGDDFGKLSSLRELYLHYVALQRLPTSFGLLTTLEKLHIWRARYLKSLPDNFGQLTALKELTINADQLEKLPDSFCLLESLRRLDIRCKNLSSLPDNFGKLLSLEDLFIDALMLQSLPASSCQLRFLKKITLRVGSAVCLPGITGQLSTLREFAFDCDEDVWRPNLFEHFLFSAREVSLTGSSVRTIPVGLGSLLYLRNLSFSYLPHLERFPEDVGELSSLENLSIVGCTSLGSLPDSLRLATSLRVLRLSGCRNLKSLPESLGKPLSPEIALPKGDAASPSPINGQGSEASKSKAVNRVLHQDVSCDGCLMTPIEGTRFKSTKSRNWNMCSKCFEKADDHADYVRINEPPDSNGLRVFIEECPFLDELTLKRLGWVDCSNCYGTRCYLKTT